MRGGVWVCWYDFGIGLLVWYCFVEFGFDLDFDLCVWFLYVGLAWMRN